MKHTKEEILNALNVIKDTCHEMRVRDCTTCPFGDNEGNCLINEIIPDGWDIKEEEIWRAFE